MATFSTPNHCLSRDFIEAAQSNQTQTSEPAQAQASYPSQIQSFQTIQNQPFHQVQNQTYYPSQYQPSFPTQQQPQFSTQRQPSFAAQIQQQYPGQSQPFYAMQTLYPNFHARPSHSLSSQQSQHANGPAYWPAYQYLYGLSRPPAASKAKSKPKQKYYKPAATETFVLSLFLLATLVFIGGIEYILRRGVPFEADTSASTVTTTANATATGTAQPHKRLNSPGSTDLHDFDGQLDYGLMPRQQDLVPVCIGVEMIISVMASDQCDTSAALCSFTTIYTKPIYDKAISTMPCYACAMEAQEIQAKGFVTATTTYCGACSTTNPATIYPCSTCEGTTLSSAPIWQITPTEPPRLYSA